MRKLLAGIICASLCSAADAQELTRETAARAIRPKIENSVAVVTMTISDVQIKNKPIVLKLEQLGLVEKMGQCVVDRWSSSEICHFRVTPAGREQGCSQPP
jgi:hypothetical protein